LNLDAVDYNDGPSQLLLDVWYACAAIRAWGTEEFRSGDTDLRKLDSADCEEPVELVEELREQRRSDEEEEGAITEEMADMAVLVLSLWMRTIRTDEEAGLDDEGVKRVEEWLRVQEHSGESGR